MLWSKEQVRLIRNHLYRWVVRPYIGLGALLALVMMGALFSTVYEFTFMCDLPWLSVNVETIGGKASKSWPLTAFVVGTFATFIAFGVMLLKAVAPERDKDGDSDNGDSVKGFGNDLPFPPSNGGPVGGV